MTVVLKRDGSAVDFDSQKIVNAIYKAMEKTEAGLDQELAQKIAQKIVSKLEKNSTEKIEVESIQDMVEENLMRSSRKDVAREYIRYRRQRDIARQSKVKVMFEEIINVKATEVTRENANMNSDTPAGMMMKFASETTKNFVDNYLLSPDVKEAVDMNLIHVHDKDYYPTKSLTCLQHPLDVIFKGGFRAGHGELRAPKRIETAATQACVSMETVQNEMHGGQAIPAFDFYLAPFVRMAYVEELKKIEVVSNKDYSHLYDAPISDYLYVEIKDDQERDDEVIKQIAINVTVGRVHQAMESFVHNMNNIHSRGGNQVVFSSINYGTDTSAEGRCIIRELLRTTERGVGNGATAIFPIQIWKLKDGASHLPSDPNYDLYKYACQVSARRFFPNFLNLNATFNQDSRWEASDPERYKYEVATMGCRTRVWGDRFGEPTSIARGNLSFTTINLPKLAIESSIKAGVLTKTLEGWVRDNDPEKKEKAIKDFTHRLEEAAYLCAKQLDERYKFQATAKACQFPLLMSGLWVGSEKLEPEDLIEPVIKHGTLGIGYIGLAEALIALTGKHHGEDEDSQKLGLETVGLIDKICKEVSDKYDHNYSCFATPAEGLSGKFTVKDRKEYGEIPGVTDKVYYTNSNHVPVYYKCSANHKARIEGAYHPLTPAGHIFYVEVDGKVVKNPEAVMDIIEIAVKNNCGYISINYNCSRCETCGYESSEEFSDGLCPKCGSYRTTYLQRITGYLVGTVNRWNSGKQAELKDRVAHQGDRPKMRDF